MGPTLGHILDSNTQALWRFDQANREDTKQVIKNSGSLGSAQNTAAATEADAAAVRPLGPNREPIRNFSSAVTVTAPANTSVVTALTGNHTLECFIYITSLAAQNNILSYSATGETLATNYLVQWFVNTSGRQGIFNESGAGVNNTVTQTTGTALAINTWYYIAVTRDATNFNFYVNGSLVQSVAKGTTPTGGTTSSWQIGTNEAATNPLTGYLAHVKLTSGTKTGTEISDAYTEFTTSFALSTGSALVHWKMTDLADTVVDAVTGASKNISLWPFVSLNMHPRAAPLIQDDAASIFFNSTYLYGFAANSPTGSDPAAVEALRVALQATAGFTFECWFKIAEAGVQNSHRGLFCFGDPGLTTSVGNFLAISITATGQIEYWSEYGTDLDSVATTTYVLPNRNARYHIGIRRNITISAKHSVDVFVNGVLVETLTNIEPYTGGTSQTVRLCNGSNEIAFYGCVDDVRISKVPRTDAEILESYQRGAGLIVPVVSSATPAPGAISKTQAVTFTVTDADGGLDYTTPGTFPTIIVRADYGSDSFGGILSETIFENNTFKGGFDGGGSTKTTITNGVSFTVIRDGNWPSASVTLHVTATDIHGNTATQSFAYTTDYLPATNNPVISSFTPAPSAITTTQSIQVDITDVDVDLARILVYATKNDGSDDLIFDGLTSGYTAAYSGLSTNTAITNGRRLIIAKSGGWDVTGFTLKVRAIDAGEREAFATGAYTTNYVYPPSGDGVGPVITSLTPANGSELTRRQAVTFNLYDVNGIKDTIITCLFEGDTDATLVYDSNGFNGRWVYSSSVIDTLSMGNTVNKAFTILPAGGWLRAPIALKVNGYDLFGKKEGVDL
jgi:hypothetical protein